MLRSSLPRPKRTNAARRAAQQHHSRPRSYRTAHQMMHPGGAAGAGGPAKPGAAGAGAAGEGAGGRRAAAQRPLGKLEKMDLLVRQQVGMAESGRPGGRAGRYDGTCGAQVRALALRT